MPRAKAYPGEPRARAATCTDVLPSRRSVGPLRIVRAPDRTPLPSAGDLLGGANGVRRPGELHEALHVSRSTAKRVASAAAGAQISTDVAGTVLLEAALVLVDVPDAGPVLVVAAREAAVRYALTAADAHYLRSLTMRHPIDRASAPPVTISVPVRLLCRAAEIDVAIAIGSGHIETALAWEIAAVASGRTMSEWALVTLLSAAASREPSARAEPARHS